LTVKGQLLKSASVIALITVISRICGYLRDQRVALLLGTSPAADSLVLVFGIPNLIRRLTGEGALGAAFIPVFTGYLKDKPRSEAWALTQRVFWDMAVVLGGIAALGVVFSRQLVHLYTLASHNPAQWDLAVYLNRIVIPAMFFLALAGIASAVLHTFQKFALPAALPIIFNLVMILFSFGVVYRPIMRLAPEKFQTPAVAIACAFLLGGIIQFAMQLPSMGRLGMKFRPELSIADPGVRKVGALMGPAVFGVGIYQINFFVDKIFSTSSRMPTGSVMSLYVAERVMQLALGVFAVAMSTAILPTMSQQAAAKDFGEMKRTFGYSLRIVSFIAIPAAVGLILLRQPIVQVLFQHGKFVAESTALTARALFYYSLGLPAFALLWIVRTAPVFTSVALTWAFGISAPLLSAIVPASALAVYPEKLTPEEGTSIWMQYLTAYGALIAHAQITRGDYVIITAASSSVGIAAIEIVKAQGAISIATTRTSKKKATLAEVGATQVIATEEEDFVARVKEITGGKGARVIFDPIGGKGIGLLAQAAAEGGTIFEYGALAPEPTPFPLFTALSKGLSVRGYTLREVLSVPQLRAKAEQYVFDHVKAGKFIPRIDRVFPFAEIVEAHRYMESNEQIGKIVVTV